MDPLKEKVELVLQQLGPDADSIAAFLEGQGIKAHHAAGNCAIAVHLQALFGLPADSVFISSRHTIVRSTPYHFDVPHSAEVYHFLTKYDRGAYPTLCASTCSHNTPPEKGA